MQRLFFEPETDASARIQWNWIKTNLVLPCVLKDAWHFLKYFDSVYYSRRTADGEYIKVNVI